MIDTFDTAEQDVLPPLLCYCHCNCHCHCHCHCHCKLLFEWVIDISSTQERQCHRVLTGILSQDAMKATDQWNCKLHPENRCISTFKPVCVCCCHDWIGGGTNNRNNVHPASIPVHPRSHFSDTAARNCFHICILSTLGVLIRCFYGCARCIDRNPSVERFSQLVSASFSSGSFPSI